MCSVVLYVRLTRQYFLFYKYDKRLKRKIKTPKSIKKVLSTYDTLKKRCIKIIELFYILSNFCSSFYA